jgi:hypothetical protein
VRNVGGYEAYNWENLPASGGVVTPTGSVCESVSTEDGGVAELIRIEDGGVRTLVAVKYERHELPSVRRRTRLSSYVVKGA